MKNFLSTPILIVGQGLSGKSAEALLKFLGYRPEDIYFFDDKKPADKSDSKVIHQPNLVFSLQPKTLVVSPGYPLNTDWIQALLQTGHTELTSELSLAARFLKSEKILAVTGSVGKSTVVGLIDCGLTSTSISCFTGGNFGVPLAKYALEVLENKRSRAEWLNLELSSYQLENFTNFSANTSIFTSLTPNHLERYQGLEHYYDTKLGLAKRTFPFLILNRQGLDLQNYVQKKLNTPTRQSLIWTDRWDQIAFPKEGKILEVRPKLLGDHNLDNLALAIRFGQLQGFPIEYFQSLAKFPGLPHRLENLGEKRNVLFINDSKATTISSVLQALRSLESLRKQRSKTWILIGGKDKNLPWFQLEPLTHERDLTFIFFGEVGEKAQQQSNLAGKRFSTLKLALSSLKDLLKDGDLVLLSPGGTSLDEFTSFEDRGLCFKNFVRDF